LRPGCQVSVDHFESRILGRTFDSFGKTSSEMFKGGCIFVDHASSHVFIETQVGFSAIETLRAKQNFEQHFLNYGIIVESYLTDSGAFKANKFFQHIRDHHQKIQYCGANAHHKNGIAERAIQTASNMARARILHAVTHWKDGINSTLWPMAVKYSSYLHNHLPNSRWLCPADLLQGSTVPRHHLRNLHDWGAPTYVLDPQLQSGNKLPRWQPCSCRGIFLGFSTIHSSEVPLILNLVTGSITPQFHVVIDDTFSTVPSLVSTEDPLSFWKSLSFDDMIYIHYDAPSSLFLPDDWLTPEER
jgi:hypothetical protein